MYKSMQACHVKEGRSVTDLAHTELYCVYVWIAHQRCASPNICGFYQSAIRASPFAAGPRDSHPQ